MQEEIDGNTPVVLNAIPTPATPQGPIGKRSPIMIGLLVGGTVLLLLCACFGVAALTIGGGIVQSITERPKVEATLDELMTNMSQEDAGAAYDQFSTRARRTVSLADLEDLLAGNNIALFSGYKSLEISTLTMTRAVNTDPDMPQGLVATVVAEIRYDDGYSGVLNATLEKEGDEWGVAGFHVNVPPDKISP